MPERNGEVPMPDYRTPGVSTEEVESGTGPPVGGGADPSTRRDHETVPVETGVLTVSLAVELVEGATGGAPAAIPLVSLEGIDAEPELKSDRFLLFLDVELPAPPGTTVVSVDGGDRYRDATREVAVTREGDPAVPADAEAYPASEPVVTVHLFEGDATVLRGIVRDTDGNRVGEGTLRVTELGFDLSAEVDANGRFVLYFEEAPDGGDVEADLELEGLDDPASVTLPVAEGEETVRTLVVDFEEESVTVETGP